MSSGVIWEARCCLSQLREAESGRDEAPQVELHAKMIPAGAGQRGGLSLGFGFFVFKLIWVAYTHF